MAKKRDRYEEKPYYSVFSGISHILESVHDNLDVLVAKNLGKSLQEEMRDNARAMFNAASTLMDDVENMGAMGQYSKSANRLEELAEDAMVVLSEHEEHGDD